MSKKAYAIDTSVLLENPKAIEILRNGVENDIYIPAGVIAELDGLKKNPRVNHVVKDVVTELDKYKDAIHIIAPKSIKTGDDTILNQVLLYNESKLPLIFVTNDKLLAIRAHKLNIKTEDFKESNPYQSESQTYSGFIDIENKEELITNCFYWKEGKIHYNKELGYPKIIGYDNSLWYLSPRTHYQNAAMELLLDDKLDLVSIQSAAGFGKTLLALAAGLHWTLERKKFKKIFVFKHNIDVGDERLGFLPGTIDEKTAPYFRPIYDLVLKLHGLRIANKLFMDPKAHDLIINKKVLEFLPINYIRGMNIQDAFVIIDECQNFSRQEMKVILSRMGDNVKCICIGDVQQIDSPYLNQSNNGLNWIVKALVGQPNYGHIILRGKHSRGPIADLVRNSIL